MVGVASGRLTGEELIDANKTVYETRERTLAIVYQIHDYRKVKSMDLTPDNIRRLAEHDKRAAMINPHIVVAVVHSGDLGFGMSRMWQAYTTEFPFVSRIFRSMDEARTWVVEQLKKTP